MSAPWHVLRLTPPPALADPLSGLLADLGAAGVWQDGPACVAYFPPGTAREPVDAALARWRGDMAACGVPCPLSPAWDLEVQGDWITAWKAHFTPLPVGRRLIVLPEWEPTPTAGDRLPVRIRPGGGFGTGGHATTATCLERLEAFIDSRPDPRALSVLDIGTGSGILALATARLGAGTVIGLDNDADAIANARDNRHLNGLHSVHLVTGTLDAVRGPFDLVVANLLAHLIEALMPDLARLLAPGGRLLLSGILNEQGDRIEAALTANGLKAFEHVSRGMWLTVEAGRD
jgi:ribosomal protein L11 methyltransferase